MNKLLILYMAIFCTLTAEGGVCDHVKNIKGFYHKPLFNNAIINGKSLDYYTFSSECNVYCLKKNLENNSIYYNSNVGNISVYDKYSVSTIIVENKYKEIISGYMTCSSKSVRYYITNPVKLVNSKKILDLQTEDYRNITRTISLQKYSQSDYYRLLKDIERLAISKKYSVGFTDYTIRNNNYNVVLKVTSLTSKGDFIFIIEQRK